MGFIDYHGTKEDRYSEVIDYAHAQQVEDWKRKQTIKIKKWLEELTGSLDSADFYIHELLKTVIVRYKELQSYEKDLMSDLQEIIGIAVEQFWEDFALELIMRHIEPFHLLPETKEKHFNAFIVKIFKISDRGRAKEFYENITDKTNYRKYLVECFDPTWKDQQFFKHLQTISVKNNSKQVVISKFLKIYRLLGLGMALYLYQAVQPRDDGWMLHESAEWNSLNNIEGKIYRKALATPEYKKIRNPLYVEDEKKTINTTAGVEDLGQSMSDMKNEAETIKSFADIASVIPKSKLRKAQFEKNIEKGDIPGYVNAGLLLLESELPEDIKVNYEQLVERMSVLQDSIDKFDSIYHADIDQFKEYFAPEALRLTATYLDYQVVEPSEKIMSEIRDNVLVATRKLLQVVDEKIAEIYKFVTIETNAEAKALEAIMCQDGYVDPNFKINKNGGN